MLPVDCLNPKKNPMKRQLLFTLLLIIFSGALIAQEWPGAVRKDKTEAADQPAGYPVVLRNTLNINTKSMEFAPKRYQNGLVYVTSRRKFGPRDQETGETFYELYYAELNPDGMPFKPEPFSTSLNSELHENSVAFNRKGDKIFFTRNNMVNGMTRTNAEGRIGMKIFEADLGPFDWENIRELPFNSDEYSCLHPTLSPDGKKLFFSSNMPGGYGNYDIWFVIWDGASWSRPINAGAQVNTTKNEVFPFMHSSGTLFFNSDGYDGEGGLDLYLIDMSDNVWGDVVNLGEPFNSPADDLSIIVSDDGRSGFFASDREGGFGKDDIYAFEAPAGIRGIKAPERAPMAITVKDAETERTLAGVDIRVFERDIDGYANDEELYDVELMPSPTNPDSMVLKYVLKSEDELGFPKATTDRTGQARFDLTMGKEYILLLSKPGYTTLQKNYQPEKDDRGKPLELTLDPSQCLTLNGVVLSEGNEQPVPNATIRIVNECNGELTMVQSKINGKFQACLASGCDFTIIAEKGGFREATTQVTTIKLRSSRSLTIELHLRAGSPNALSEPIREGTIIILEDLFYDFNKSAIRSREARALEGLSKLMHRYPSMEIELGAHTDSRGSGEYNLKLSLKRADSAKEFLVQQGIAAHRVKTFGYGETRLRNHCGDGVSCDESEHEFNRRTEVKVTRINEPVEIGYRGER